MRRTGGEQCRVAPGCPSTDVNRAGYDDLARLVAVPGLAHPPA